MYQFNEALNNHVLLLDGAMGTEIQKLHLSEFNYPGGHASFNDGLSLSRPDIISNIHESYLEAGADCITTNTFGSNKIKLDEYAHGDQTEHINETAVKIASEVAKKYDGKYVIGTIGPSGLLPSSSDPAMQCELDYLKNAYLPQIRGLICGGVNALVIETSTDILELKTIISAIKSLNKTIPVIANVTFPINNNMLLGTPADAAYVTVSGMDIDVFGINCSTGPEDMIPSIEWLDEHSEHSLLVMPNAGIPDNDYGDAIYDMTAEDMSKTIKHILEWYDKVRIVGGCCGTTPEHIKQLRNVIDRHVGQ